MKFGTYLMALVEPLLIKILFVLGISIVTVAGVDTSLVQIKNMMTGYVDQAGALLDFALYLWIGKGIGIVLGACTAKLALWKIQTATQFLAKSPG